MGDSSTINDKEKFEINNNDIETDNNNNNKEKINIENNNNNTEKNTFKSSLSSFLSSYYNSSSNSNSSSNNNNNNNKTTYFGHVRNSISYVTSSLPIPSYNSLPSFNIPLISYISNSIPFPISYSKNNNNNNNNNNIPTKTTQPILIKNNENKQQLDNNNFITPINMSPNSFNSISIESNRLIVNNNIGTDEQYQDIIRRLEQNNNKLHLISLDTFIENIKNDTSLSIDDISSSVQAYIATTLPMLMNVCASIPFQTNQQQNIINNIQMDLTCGGNSKSISSLSGKPINEIELIIYEFMEQYITSRLYRRIFSSADGIQKDTQLCEHISKFQHITPSNLDINDSIISTQFLEQIQEELLHMTAYKSPREKLMCIKKSFKLLFQLLSKAQLPPSVVGADLLLPIVIYCLIKSNLPFLFSNLQFISLFRDPTLIESETSYFLVTMITATSFIENMTFESLTDAVDPYKQDQQPIESVNNNNNNNSNQIRIDGATTEKQQDVQFNDDGNSLQQHELNKDKENTVNENNNNNNSNNVIKVLLSEVEKKKLFKFYNSKPEDLTVKEIRQLLKDYNQLVDKYCENNNNNNNNNNDV